MRLRPAAERDQAAIRRIVRAARINPSGLEWPRFLVAEEAGAIVGVGQVKPHRDGTRELASIAVVPDRQGRGIGTAIVNALIAREHGEVLHLTCRREMQGYYEKFGFELIQRANYPPYFARRMPALNAFLRAFGIRIIVMRRLVTH